LSIDRSPEFLNWRYGAHPDTRYRVFVLRRFRNIPGFAIVSIQDSVARLVDFGFPENPILSARMLRGVAELLEKDGVERMEAWLNPEGPETAHFRAAGFSLGPDSRDLRLVTVPFQRGVFPGSGPSGFRFTMGDSDLY